MKVIPQTLFFLFLGIGFPQVFWAQSPLAPANTLEARLLIVNAHTAFDSTQYKLAGECAELAYEYFKAEPEAAMALEEAAFWSGKAAFAQKKFAKAQSFFTESVLIRAKLEPEGSAKTASIWTLLGKTLVRLGKYDEAIEAMQKALDMQVRFVAKDHPDHADALLQMGIAQLEKSTYTEAILYFQKAADAFRICHGERSKTYATAQEKLAQAYLYNGFYKESITGLEKVLLIQQQILPASHPDFARTYMSMGAFYKYIRKYDDALFYYNQALAIQLAQNELNHNGLADCYSQIGQALLYKKELHAALAYFQKEDSIMIASGENLRADYLYTCSDLGKAYLAMENYPEAVRWQAKALEISQTASKSDNTNTATLSLYLGRALSGNGQYAEAIQLFQTNEQMLKSLYGPDCNILYHNNAEMGHAYAKWYSATQQDSLLYLALDYFNRAKRDVEKNLRAEVLPDARQKLLNETPPYFERSIEAELLFTKIKPLDSPSLENAWQISEKMHGHLLLSATQEADARHFAGIPDMEMRQDSMLQAKLFILGKNRRSLIESKGLALSDSLVLSVDTKISETRAVQDQLRKSFEQKYPDYFRLKYALQNSSLAKTQQLLSPQQTLLEFFVGDASIFVFVVQPKTSRVVKIPRDFPLTAWVQALREGISGYHTAAQKTPAGYQSTVQQYADAAQQLYNKLLAPIAESLTPELIIVPGESLYNLPFEALLSAAPKDLSNFGTYPFLLKNHAVHYAYSATMLHQMMERKHRQTTTNGLLAFAPFYGEDTTSLTVLLRQETAIRLGFSALPFSGEEVFRAKTRYGGRSKVWLGEAASKQTFLELAAKYRILHLATHGKANPAAGEFSFLAFAGLDDEGVLTVGELYNLPIYADLVVLSACETGIGEQQRGEGVLSLARAFAFAGAKSIVASLWSVNDQSTMQVMDNFYKEIKSGKPKNIALADAKRSYLLQNPGLGAHPFFWAGFVALGDMTALKN